MCITGSDFSRPKPGHIELEAGRSDTPSPPLPPSQKARYLAGILSCLDASIARPITTTRTSSPGSARVTPCLTYGGTELQRGRGGRHARQAQLLDSQRIRQFLSVSQRSVALWPSPLPSRLRQSPCALFIISINHEPLPVPVSCFQSPSTPER